MSHVSTPVCDLVPGSNAAIRETADLTALNSTPLAADNQVFSPVNFTGISAWLNIDDEGDFAGRVVDFGNVNWLEHSAGPTTLLTPPTSMTGLGFCNTGLSGAKNQHFIYAMPTALKNIKVKINGSLV